MKNEDVVLDFYKKYDYTMLLTGFNYATGGRYNRLFRNDDDNRLCVPQFEFDSLSNLIDNSKIIIMYKTNTKYNARESYFIHQHSNNAAKSIAFYLGTPEGMLIEEPKKRSFLQDL